MSVNWDGWHMGGESEQMRRMLGVLIASGAALLSIYIVFSNGSFTTSAWALMLSVPLSLAIGLSGSGAEAGVEYVIPLPDDQQERSIVESREVEPDDLPVL